MTRDMHLWLETGIPKAFLADATGVFWAPSTVVVSYSGLWKIYLEPRGART